MNITVLEASNYFKGLLLLTRKDRKIAESEIALMKHVGKRLGFEKGFCDEVIRDILGNEYIDDRPPVFSTKELALVFLKDGLLLAFSDNEFDTSEELWLRATAERNGIEPEEYLRERRIAAYRGTFPLHMEVDNFTVVLS